MRLVSGLGNPGPEYEGTRHNVGYEVVDRLAREAGIYLKRVECRALVGRGKIGDEPLMLAKPITYMNASGEAVTGLLTKLKLEPGGLLVVADEIDLPLGVLRLKARGSSAGQKGLKSIEACLGTREFARLRIGIRGERYSRERELGDYVLDRFARSERDAGRRRARSRRRSRPDVVVSGIDTAMNRFNALSE